MINFNIDPTRDTMKKSIFYLSVPMMLEMSSQTLFNLVDTFFVSRINYNAIGALVSSSIILMLVISIGIGISTANGIYVANYWGSKNKIRLRDVYSNAVLIAVVISILSAFLFNMFITDIINLIGLSGVLKKYTQEYLQIASLGLPLQFILSVNNSTLRSIGAPVLALNVMIVANVMNVIFDPLFIFYFKLGIKGAAIATITSVFLSIIVQFLSLYQKEIVFKLSNFNWKMVFLIVKKGIFATMHLFFRISSMLVLIKLVAEISQTAVASYSIVIRIYQILLFMVFGFANAAFVIVGQNLGANLTERVRKGTYDTLIIATLSITALDVVMFLNAQAIIGIFTKDILVINIAKNIFFYIAVSYPFIVANTVAARSSMGMHDTARPSLINLVNLWMLQLPLAYVLSKKIGLNGIWIAIAASNITGFVMNFFLLKYNLLRVVKYGNRII